MAPPPEADNGNRFSELTSFLMNCVDLIWNRCACRYNAPPMPPIVLSFMPLAALFSKTHKSTDSLLINGSELDA